MNLKALHKLSYGMYVVGSTYKDDFTAMIANVAIQVTSNPKTVAVSVARENLTYKLIKSSGIFSISVLKKSAPMKFISALGFPKKGFDKLSSLNYNVIDGVPVFFDHACAYMTAKVVGELEVGTHCVFVGEIINADVLDDSEVMTYEYYKSIKGATPRTAPTFNIEMLK